MSRNSSTNSKLSNIQDALHNFNTPDVDDECFELYQANYLFMKQSPMYVRLEQKYKNLKKKLREQSKMIDLLNKQYFETVEKYAGLTALTKHPVDTLSFDGNPSPDNPRTPTHLIPHCSGVPTKMPENIQIEIKPEHIVSAPKTVEVVDLTKEVTPIISVEEVVIKNDHVEPTVEEELYVKETKVIVEEVVDEEVVDEEVVEEEEFVEEEEVVEEEEEETEEQEEEGVYETVINGKKYYITNETNGEIYAILDDDDIGDIVGKYVNGVPIFTTK